MGYGEVGGGGSLQWQMSHKNGTVAHDPGSPGHPKNGHGVDPDVTEGDPLYIVIKRGAVILADATQVIVRVSLANRDDVQLVWGAELPASLEDAASTVTSLDLSELGADRTETT